MLKILLKMILLFLIMTNLNAKDYKSELENTNEIRGCNKLINEGLNSSVASYVYGMIRGMGHEIGIASEVYGLKLTDGENPKKVCSRVLKVVNSLNNQNAKKYLDMGGIIILSHFVTEELMQKNGFTHNDFKNKMNKTHRQNQ